MVRYRSSWIAAIAAAVLGACGGGKGGGGSTPPPPAGRQTQITAAIAVDPYLVGAVLAEQKPDGTHVQASSASDATGRVTFPAPLTSGNVVVLTVNGIHGGAPYQVTLRRTVDVGGSDAIVVSPMTTLLADGTRTPAQIAALLGDAVGATITVDDLLADPMARLLDGDASAADRHLLAAAIATSASLQMLQGNAASADLGQLLTAIAPKLEQALQAGTDPHAVANVAAAVASYVATHATTAQEALAVSATVDATLLAGLVSLAQAGGAPAIVADVEGTPHAVVATGTVAESLAKAFDALDRAVETHGTDAFLQAVNQFSAAAGLASADGNATQGDRDRARFFAAVARLGLLARPYSDGDGTNGLHALGDLLDGFGFAPGRAQRESFDTMELPVCRVRLNSPLDLGSCTLQKLPADSPRSGALQAFLFSDVGSGLQGAVALLSAVTPAFLTRVTLAGHEVELDYTDVLFVKGLAQAALAVLHVQAAYDLDVDLDDLQARSGTGYLVQDFLQDNPLVLKLKSAAKLPAARDYALAAATTLKAAGAALAAEEDTQEDDLVRFATESCGAPPGSWTWSCTIEYNQAAELAKFQEALTEIQRVASAQGEVSVTVGTSTVVVDPTKFFDGAGVDLRAALPALPFSAGAFQDRAGPFLDPSFGGVLVSPLTLNEDLDGDGSPDLFGGFTYFFDGYLAARGVVHQFPEDPANPWGSTWYTEYYAFDGAGRFSAHVDWYGPSGYDTLPFTGGYSFSGNALTIALDQPGLHGVTTGTLVADAIDESGFGGTAAYLLQDGSTYWSGADRWYRW